MLRMFYFSGTGNARNVAKWMASAWRSRGREALVTDIAAKEQAAIAIGPDDEIGLASPTHGFNFPPITLKFIFAFPRTSHANRLFIVNTRAGVRFFGICLPGLSGAAQLLAAVVFAIKGYRVVGMRPIDLPSNWISLHPGLAEENIRAIYRRCEEITSRFAARLLDGGRDLRALRDLPVDLLISIPSLAYYFIGRFFFAKSFIASRECDACGICVKQCPISAVTLEHDRPFWSYRCESCMRCMNHCPKRAIETAHGFVIGLAVLVSLAMKTLVYPALRPFIPALPENAGAAVGFLRFVLESWLMVGILFLAYFALHRGLKFRIIERLAVLSSLTHHRFWRRYKAPRGKDCAKATDTDQK